MSTNVHGDSLTATMEHSALRKSHRKSRKGCRECKRRHVKCDEKRPTCSACARLELTCDYSHRLSAHPLAVSTPVPTDVRACSQTQERRWTTSDMALLHHYTTCCCICVPGEHRRQLWTHQLVTVALSQEYLLYQMLAVGALHLFHQDPSREELAARAADYRGRALQHVNSTLVNMNADLAVPVFAFAGLSMVYAFAELAILRQSGAHDFDPIQQISECLKQNFGINTVVGTYRADIQNSWAGELININSDEEFDHLASSDLEFAHSAMLRSLIDRHEPRARFNRACHDALNVLLQTLQILMWRQEDHFTFHLINAWPSNLKSEFWELLEARAPLSLLVLAYYSALISLRPRLWWFKHWPQLLLGNIETTLGEEWREALAWPKRIVDRLPPAAT